MRLFITGAGGFVGSYVSRVAMERGHMVTGLVRSQSSAAALAEFAPGIETVTGDLRVPETWRETLADTDAVVHLAATKAGDVYQQFPGTVVATERLLAQMEQVGVRRLVHVSTFSVYDYTTPAAGSILDEASPVTPAPLNRDAYTQTKLRQERLVREAAARGLAVTIIRPGAVWGRGELWDGGLGQVLGPLWLAVGDGVTRKFTYVENCAEAIVLAAERDEAIGKTLNVVDDETPTRRQYARTLRTYGVVVPRSVPLPFGVIRWAVRAIDRANVAAFHGRARLPSMLTPASLDARFKPLVYPNDRVKAVLAWEARYGLDEGLRRTLGSPL